MRRFGIICVFSLAITAIPLFAEGGPFGLGIVAGDPTGISMAYKIGERNTIQGALAWDLVSPGGFVVTADYLFRFDDVLKIDELTIPLYAGLGGVVTVLVGDGTYGDSDSSFGLGVRIPLGARWEFSGTPLEAFLEIVPGIRLFPDTSFEFGGGIGVRWYF